jgi:hypothetical protein
MTTKNKLTAKELFERFTKAREVVNPASGTVKFTAHTPDGKHTVFGFEYRHHTNPDEHFNYCLSRNASTGDVDVTYVGNKQNFGIGDFALIMGITR